MNKILLGGLFLLLFLSINFRSSGQEPGQFEIFLDDIYNKSDISTSNLTEVIPLYQSPGQAPSYVKDSLNVYYITVTDIGSGLSVLRTDYYQLSGADPATFLAFDDKYSKDADKVYFKEGEMVGADPATFEILSNGYSKDANYVYINSDRLTGADPATFVVFDNASPFIVGADKTSMYFRGVKTRIDYKTFHHESENVFRDKSYVYALSLDSNTPIVKTPAAQYDRMQKKRNKTANTH